MAGNKESDPGREAGEISLAAGSVGEFFEKKDWQIVSFFPNTPCARKRGKSAKKPAKKD